MKRQEGRSSFNLDEIRNYLHLIAAIQANVDVTGKDVAHFSQYNSIKFTSRKDKDGDEDDKDAAEDKVKVSIGGLLKKILFVVI